MDWLNNTNTIISIFAGAIAIITPIILRFKKRKNSSTDKAPTHNIASRFVAIFEAHGVHRNQIPVFFDHGLSLFHCSTDEELIKHLTNEILEETAKLFAINIEWLQGASEDVYPIHNFYKCPRECVKFIDALRGKSNNLGGYFFSPEDEKINDGYNAAIVITEEIGKINNRAIERIHILGGWVFGYWKSRAYLTACASVALNNQVWLIGKECDNTWLTEFCAGKKIPEYDFAYGELKFNTSRTWYVDEFIETPELYIRGVRPEHDNFGIQAAISKWLELENNGFMAIDRYKNNTQIREYFENYKI